MSINECTRSPLCEMAQRRDEAVAFIRVMAEELVLAGGMIGDRTTALANLRALLAERDALRVALQAVPHTCGHHPHLGCGGCIADQQLDSAATSAAMAQAAKP